MFESKAPRGLQTERTRKYVSIAIQVEQRSYRTLDGVLKPFLICIIGLRLNQSIILIQKQGGLFIPWYQ